MGSKTAGRKRIKTANKGKRWKKGQSSSSNPEARKHRHAAKSRFFSVNTGPSDLTVEALAKHDAGDKDDDAILSECGSESHSVGSAKTFNTWATNWTECTNTTFGRVHRYWSSNSAIHKEILAVLAAITEVIKTQGGKETETEYFAALMTALETMDSDDSLTAVTYLLSLVIKRVPVPVLRSRFSEISKSLLNILATHSETSTASLLRSCIMCLAHLLRVQEQAVWSNSSTTQVYHGLLNFATHSKPKVRKAAQHAVRAVLKGSVFMTQTNAPPHHPATSTTAKYCIQQIEQCGGTGEAGDTLHSLGLLKDILAVFPHHSLKSTCETILRAMTLSNIIVTSTAMKALHGMFLMQPEAKSLPAELNAQIITALYDYQPRENDLQPIAAWLAVMERAHVNLFRLKEDLCLSHLPRLFRSCMKCMQTDNVQVSQVAAKTLMNVLKECVSPAAGRLQVMVESTHSGSPAHDMFSAVESGLSYQYHMSWGLVLQVLTVFFEVLGKACHSIMKKCLLSLADLRDSYEFPHKPALDRAVGMAIRTMGPRIVLEAIPLQITGENDDPDFPRSWLIPVLRDNIRETELSFFVSYFLPLAARLRTKSMEFAKEDQTVLSKTYDTLQMQMWSLLAGFCIRPTDLRECFKNIAKILGSAITDRPDLCYDVMASLRKLVTFSLDNEESRTEMGKFAKNFLPLFFNQFTTAPEKEKDSQRLAVLETIKCYMQITDKKLIGSFFDKCSGKLDDEDTTTFRRHALIDLCLGMVSFIGPKRLKWLYTHATQHLESTDKTIQKKCYRILEDVCSVKSEESRDFVKDHLTSLQEELLKSLSSSSPSSKAPRLKCLIHIFKQLDTEEMNFLAAVLPEAILCTRETAERARGAAYSLLVEMGNSMVRWTQDEQEPTDAIKQYFELVLAGLGGLPHLVSCTVLALTRILFEFKALITSELLAMLAESTCLLLTSKAREIVKSALGLVKVILSVFPESSLAQFLQKIVNSLVTMKEDNRHHFRFKAKEIFTRLIRKFGYEVIYGMVPVGHQKMLANIRKTQERAKKQKKEKETKEEDDEEEEEDFSGKHTTDSIEDLLRDTDSELEEESENKEKKKKKKKTEKNPSKTEKRGAAWLKEGGDEEIVDFLDPSVSKKVLATKPGSDGGKKGGLKHGFQTAPDGRLIIREDSDSEDESKQKKKPEVELDDLDELLEAIHVKGHGKGKKRKASSGDDNESNFSSYKPGGHGIHRAVDAKKKKTEGPPGAEYKAKKAGGDIKRKGKPDPYAYVPLQMQMLNKRKRAKSAGQFKSLVRGAKKGALKGQKLRSRNK